MLQYINKTFKLVKICRNLMLIYLSIMREKVYSRESKTITSDGSYSIKSVSWVLTTIRLTNGFVELAFF